MIAVYNHAGSQNSFIIIYFQAKWVEHHQPHPSLLSIDNYKYKI